MSRHHDLPAGLDGGCHLQVQRRDLRRIGFLTANPTLQGYIDAVTQNYGGDISIWRAFINTYSFVIPKVIFTVISSVIAAYGFSRFKFKGRDMLFGIMISTLFLPQVVLTFPST